MASCGVRRTWRKTTGPRSASGQASGDSSTQGGAGRRECLAFGVCLERGGGSSISPPLVESEQEPPADHVLELAVALHPIPGSAHQARKFLPLRLGMVGDEVTDEIDISRVKVAPPVGQDRCHGFVYPMARKNVRIFYAGKLTPVNGYNLSSKWSFQVEGNYVLSDDSLPVSWVDSPTAMTSSIGSIPTAGEPSDAEVESSDSLSRDQGRHRYWNNDLALSTEYAFAEDSLTGAGYTFTVLRNDDSGGNTAGSAYDDYDEHDFFGQYAYRFNRNWRTDLEGHYILGIFDEQTLALPERVEEELNQLDAQDNDLQEYHLTINIEYDRSEKDSFPLIYSFIETNYDEPEQADIWAHQATIGWDHAFNEHTKLSVGVGPSYVGSQDLDGEWNYNAFGTLTRAFQHASLQCILDKQYETNNFTGSSDSGFTDRYHAGLRLDYTHNPDLSMSAFADYTNDILMNPQGKYLLAGSVDEGMSPAEQQGVGDITYDTKYYTVGIGMLYAVTRWLNASFEYSYFDQDADLPSDRYNEHRFLFTLSAKQDFRHW